VNPYLAGAVVGIGGTLLAVFGLLSGMDNRYVTRRESDATLLDIRTQLNEIKGALGIGKRVG
jgi:hypothetical protein